MSQGPIGRGDFDPAEGPPSVAYAELIAALERIESADSRADRSKALLRFATLLGDRTRRLGARVLAGGRPMADLVLELAPHLPIRDLAKLREHFDGRFGEELADGLVEIAMRETATVGMAGGAVAAAEWAATPTLVAVPIQILAETVAVALIEIKLVAELHAVYQVPIPGNAAQRGVSYVVAWAGRRGIDPCAPTRIPVALGIVGRREIAHRLGGRMARNLGTLAPMLLGAVIGARWNRSETKRLALDIRADLRDR
jgi:hypothetical protein